MRLLLLEIRFWQRQPAARQQDSARLLMSFRGGCLRFSGSCPETVFAEITLDELSSVYGFTPTALLDRFEEPAE
jgi:hypothetical protein